MAFFWRDEVPTATSLRISGFMEPYNSGAARLPRFTRPEACVFFCVRHGSHSLAAQVVRIVVLEATSLECLVAV